MFSIIRKIIIFLILLFFIYLIVSLIIKHKLIQKKNEEDTKKELQKELDNEYLQEGFTFNTQSGELNGLQIKDGSLIMVNIAPKKSNLPLREYFMKASYNTALTGSYINTDMVKYVLSRGCRFLDFEVYSFDNIPYVAYSSDNTFSSIKTLNKIPLQDILNTVVMYGFISPSPNPLDPLFIHLRVKTNNNDLYEKIAIIVDATLKSKLYTGTVTSRTYLSDLMNKIVLIVDKKLAPKYQSFPECGTSCVGPKNTLAMNANCPSCFSLKNYVNIESGTTFLRIYNYSYIMDQSYTSPEIMDDGLTTDVNSMKIVIPDIGTNFMGCVRNPSCHFLPLNYGVQIVAYPFYQNDIYLDQYEQAFADGKSAFVPLSTMIHFVNKITNSYQS